jgi:peptide/nickel transport system ATP-binding protein
LPSNILTVSDLTVQYTGENKRLLATALDNVSLTLPEKDTLGVVGESGSGKTTLGMSILNLIQPPGRIVNGAVDYMGQQILHMNGKELRKYRWREVSMVYQSAMNSLNPVKPVCHPIAEVLVQHKGLSKREAYQVAVKMISDVGIRPERAYDFPHEMSGGMRQRIVIALAMALSPKILIADEPTSALDVVTQKHILELIKREIGEKGLTLIFITHEISLLNGLVNNIAVMYAGEVVEHGSFKDILFEPLHPYTEMLVGTLLTMESSLKGMSAASMPESRPTSIETSASFCKYASRCKYAFDRCREERPMLLATRGGRKVACHKYT